MQASDLPTVQGCHWKVDDDSTARLICSNALQFEVRTEKFDTGKVRSITRLTAIQGDESFTYPMRREADAIAMAAELAAADNSDSEDAPVSSSLKGA